MKKEQILVLIHLKQKQKSRNKWGITPEMIFEPVHIISLEGFSELAAKDVVEKLKIQIIILMKLIKIEMNTNVFMKLY